MPFLPPRFLPRGFCHSGRPHHSPLLSYGPCWCR